ncbi:hypothetical protein [Nocardioides terrisoli]|uniref:hypothetical protein n=1 Tax=Nocardioides terrisoli TaxID=3388267 RepID=UPI00287BAB53|nr:hypothetical protein [Nocardioides marmorisolisilvae]
MRRIWIPLALAALAVLAWWPLGFLPWFSAGLDWPTTIAAPVGSSSEGLAGLRMPLPLIAVYLPALVCCAVVGGTIAGLLPILVLQIHLPRPAAILEVWLVVAVTVVVTLALSTELIRQHAPTSFAADTRVLVGLTAAVVAGTLLGLVVGSLSVHWHGLASLAAALVAGAAPTWVRAFLYDGSHAPAVRSWADALTGVLVALVLSSGLVVSVHRSRRWAGLWPVALLVLWCAGPAVAALTYLTAVLRPSSGLPDSLPGHLAAARQVFGQAFTQTHPQLWPMVVAFGLGLAWLALGALRGRQERPAPAS